MANCRYCDISNDDDSKEYYICESCRAQEPWKKASIVCQNCDRLQAENAELRKVVEAARDWLW